MWQVGVLRLPRLHVALSDMESTGEAPQARPQRTRAGARRYYVRLLVNGQVVDDCMAADLKEDFTVDLKDVFRSALHPSILHWSANWICGCRF